MRDFHLSQRNRESWRIDLPIAIVSMSVIDPTVSKYMRPLCIRIGVVESHAQRPGRASRATVR
jgi:hypothetical protein